MSVFDLSRFDGKLIDGLQFCARVYKLFETIRSSDDGRSRLRMRSSPLEKKLIEELLPICKYVQANYRPGRYISTRWVNGNQQYDAEFVQRGDFVAPGYYPSTGYFEVTCVMHPKEYLARELLNKKGYAFGLEGIQRIKNGEISSQPVGYSGKEFIDSFSQLVLKQINKKADIPYPNNTTLIVDCTLNTAYTPDEWKDLVAQVNKDLPKVNFLEIFMYDGRGQYSHTFWPEKIANSGNQTGHNS